MDSHIRLCLVMFHVERFEPHIIMYSPIRLCLVVMFHV